MALKNYIDLQTTIALWLHRTDLAPQIPDFIRLAESRLNRLVIMAVLEREQVIPTTPGSYDIPLPPDFGRPKAVWLDGRSLGYVQVEDMDLTRAQGKPSYWCITGDRLRFDCPADGVYLITLRYTEDQFLSTSNPTNPILTKYPDAYLYASLIEAAPFIRDDQRLPLWQERFDRLVDEILVKETDNKTLATLRVDFGLRANGYNIYEG